VGFPVGHKWLQIVQLVDGCRGDDDLLATMPRSFHVVMPVDVWLLAPDGAWLPDSL